MRLWVWQVIEQGCAIQTMARPLSAKAGQLLKLTTTPLRARQAHSLARHQAAQKDHFPSVR
jgi:hypothetical protein